MSPLSHLVRLEEVASFMGGSTPSRARTQYFGGGIPWVKTTDLNNGLISSTEETLTELGLQESSCKMIPANAVLVAMYGGFNQIGRTGLLMNDSAINQALTAIIPDELKLDAAFLLEWLNFRVDYWKRFAGSSRKDPNITKGDVADFPVPNIPVEQQREAARVLAEWSSAIKKTERLIRLRIEQKAWLLSKVVSIPGKLTALGTFLKQSSRPVPKPVEPYWALGLRSHGKGTFQRFVEDPSVVEMEELFCLRRDELIVNITFAWEGAIAFVGPDDEHCLVSHRFPTYEVLREVADPNFVRQIVNRKAFFKRLALISPGGAGRNRVLNKRDFLKLEVSLPPLEEQTRLARYLGTIDTLIEQESSQLQALKTQKRGLMQKLLTGQWRLNENKEISHG